MVLAVKVVIGSCKFVSPPIKPTITYVPPLFIPNIPDASSNVSAAPTKSMTLVAPPLVSSAIFSNNFSSLELITSDAPACFAS